MRRFLVSVFAALAAGVFVTAEVGQSAQQPSTSGELSVHEWGTFTTVAGVDGQAIDWLPLGGPSDLPCFVEHFNSDPLVKVLATGQRITRNGTAPDVAYDDARRAMSARVRMETPVLYFYSDRDTTVHVRVRFHHGLMTEWYPPAAVSQGVVGAATLHDPSEVSAIEWPTVRVTPAATPKFAAERGESHYYAARATDAAPISVGGERERFLFYRGVADFDAPLSATVQDNGDVRLRNLSPSEIPAVVIFERRGERLGFRVVGALGKEQTVAPPKLDGSLDSLHETLERSLVSNGLTAKEAAAMLATWRDSWFEEGTRVFYVVPRAIVDDILPLEISPAPSKVTRVFVGRMEVLTPRTVHAVRAAIDAQDQSMLTRYARFLGPITDRILSETSDDAVAARIRDVTNKALVAYLRRAAICE
jgi:hypothetical protein